MSTKPRRQPETEDAAKKDAAKKDAVKKHEDEALDEALEETFPASDPPAATEPGHHRDAGASDEAPKPAPRR